MSSWKTVASKAIGDALNVHIVRKGRSGPLLEEDLLATFLSRFKVDCVFDVGANSGQYARMLRRIGYTGSIISFEPIPNLATQLRAKASKDANWYVEQIALDEAVGSGAFNVMANDRFSSLKQPNHVEVDLFQEMNVVVETITVRKHRLDAVYDAYRRRLSFDRAFLKLDTQGNDLAVSRGAGARLADFVGLQSELSVKRIYEGQSDYREAIDFFETAGFVLTGLVPNNAGHFPTLVEIDCIMHNPALTSNSPGKAG